MKRPPLQDITVGEQLRRTAEQYGDRPALVWKEQRWTYRELDRDTDLMAAGLLQWGMKRGDVLGIWCETEASNVLMMYAAAKIGVIAAMINTSLQAEEVEDILRRSDVRFLAIGEGYKDISYPDVCRALPVLPMLEKVFTIGATLAEGMDDMCALMEAGRMLEDGVLEAAKAAVQTTDGCTMLYTSGTTSRPKVVLDTHHSRMNMGIQQSYDLHCTCEDRFCVAMPLFHCFCISVNTLAALSAGGCLVLCADRHTDTIFRTVATERCTVLHCVPTLFHALISRKDFDAKQLSSLRIGYIGGSMYPPELFMEIEQKMGFKLMSSLGQTEAAAGVTTCEVDDPLEVRAHTVGHFLAYMEHRIVHVQDGHVCGVGEMGELCIKGYSVMKCYYKAPEATAKAIDADGYLHTGDLGYEDEQGNVHLTGRLKDLIIRGGENISPAEIEHAASLDERVSDCRAIGVPDTHYGEEVCLCVQLEPGAVCTAEELRAQLARQLAHYKVPRYVCFVEEFPRTNTGKIRTGELGKIAAAMLEPAALIRPHDAKEMICPVNEQENRAASARLTRREQAEQTRLLVFNTAISLLEEKDFEAITIRDIVKAAGVSIGTFYNYFSTKLDVFYETYYRADEYFAEKVEPLLVQPELRARLLYYFEQYASYSAEHTPLKLTKVLYNSSNKCFLRHSPNGMIPVLCRTLEKGKRDGQLASEETPERLAEYLMISARGLVYDWCIHGGDYELLPAMQRHMAMAMACCIKE